jgi:hypothetical protein
MNSNNNIPSFKPVVNTSVSISTEQSLKTINEIQYIEVPANTKVVPYTDKDGNKYEISLQQLIEYDGNDHEIQYIV